MIHFANASLDPDTRMLRAEKAVKLSPAQSTVLAALAERPGALVVHDKILDALWGDKDDGPGVTELTVYVSKLRKHLAEVKAAAVIQSHPGAGYSIQGAAA